jgi:hypothetical protein
LLPVAATLLKVGTKLELIATTHFYALPIIYTGVLAESGSAKSPTQKVILEPLFDMQSKADDEYNNRLEDYEAAKAGKRDDIPPKPKPREYYTIDSTREAIATIQSQQPDRGFLGWFDELSALIGGQNQYRNGRGSDKESILSGRDGTGLKVNRASGKRIHVPALGLLHHRLYPARHAQKADWRLLRPVWTMGAISVGNAATQALPLPRRRPNC